MIPDIITVHHLENSRSQRVLWLLEELGLEYEVKRYPRHPRTLLAPPELKDLHPLGKSPIVTVAGDGASLVLAETGAIMDYFLRRFGPYGLLPAIGTQTYQDYVYWMYYAEGSAMTPLLLKLICDNIRKRAPFLIKPVAGGIASQLERTLVTPNLKAHFGLWDKALQRSGWFAGEAFSAADIMMSFPLEAAVGRTEAASLASVRDFLTRIHAREAYQRALKRGGPYAYA
jgi:glutathione S-transferase